MFKGRVKYFNNTNDCLIKHLTIDKKNTKNKVKIYALQKLNLVETTNLLEVINTTKHWPNYSDQRRSFVGSKLSQRNVWNTLKKVFRLIIKQGKTHGKNKKELANFNLEAKPF